MYINVERCTEMFDKKLEFAYNNSDETPRTSHCDRSAVDVAQWGQFFFMGGDSV